MKAMNSASSKEPPIIVAYPKTLLSIAASVGGLAVFLIFASLLLVSHPIGSTVHGYFYGIDRSGTFDSVPLDNKSAFTSHPDSNVVKDGRTSDSSFSGGDETLVNSQAGGNGRADLRNGESVIHAKHGDGDVIVKNGTFEFRDTNEVSYSQQGVAISSSAPQNVSKLNETFASSQEGKNIKNSLFPNITEVVENPKPPFQSLPDNPSSQTDSINIGCDLYHGKWVYDLAGPLYTNNSCPVLTQMQNCQGNGRPDKEYENWRWKPAHCDLPRFDGKKFLELMRGKTLAFIGDSVARNQMESMLCILWQVEIPKNRGNRRMQRYQFKSTSTMIVRIWSSWLVHKTSEPFDFAPEGVAKLHLDAPDPDLMEIIPNFDVVVISSGHWFAKQSAYVLNNEIVGGQLWWPDKSRPMKINSVEAFGISVETILSAMATNPNYTGLTILRSYSPDHYEGGAWNTGGSCTGKVKPVLEGELVENGFTNIMYEKQVAGFNRANKKQTNKSKLRLMDITKAFGYRQDGHPGPYRSPDPNKITKRGPDGRPPPQDCLHWCMPGPVDTWNELVYEIIRREFEGS